MYKGGSINWFNLKCVGPSAVSYWIAQGWHRCNRFSPDSEDNQGFFDVNSFSIYPNPVTYTSIISFGLLNQQKVAIKVYDMTGKLLSVVVNKEFNTGENELVFVPPAGKVKQQIEQDTGGGTGNEDDRTLCVCSPCALP